ncbi:MAG: lamin tail domain-containing protein, partial [Verrucomicrobiota bacterium]
MRRWFQSFVLLLFILGSPGFGQSLNLRVSKIHFLDPTTLRLDVDGAEPDWSYRLEGIGNLMADSWEPVEGRLVDRENAQFGIEVDLEVAEAPHRFFRVVGQSGFSGPVSIQINEVMTDNETSILDGDGDAPDWIELANTGEGPVSLEGFYLSDSLEDPLRWRFPAVTIEPGGFLLVFASGKDRADSAGYLHTDFKLKTARETVLFSGPDGEVIDRFAPGPIGSDESFARSIKNPEVWLPVPAVRVSPGKKNTNFIFGEPDPYIEAATYSVGGGLHEGEVTVELSVSDPENVIHYTLDGSEPTRSIFAGNSPVYEKPLVFDSPTVLRSQVFTEDGEASRIRTQTYLVGVSHQLPVLSLAGDPEDYEINNGRVYGFGSQAFSGGQIRGTYPYNSSNAWKNLESETNLEMFETDGDEVINQMIGVKVFGGWGSRAYPQKSLALFARKEYGLGKIRH